MDGETPGKEKKSFGDLFRSSRSSRKAVPPPRQGAILTKASELPKSKPIFDLIELTTASSDTFDDPSVPDIVAIHGLMGDVYKTWTHENGKFWLRDFLPEGLEGKVRIFTFGYEA